MKTIYLSPVLRNKKIQDIIKFVKAFNRNKSIDTYGFKHIHNWTQEATICGHFLYNDVCIATAMSCHLIWFPWYNSCLFLKQTWCVTTSQPYLQCDTAPCVIMVYWYNLPWVTWKRITGIWIKKRFIKCFQNMEMKSSTFKIQSINKISGGLTETLIFSIKKNSAELSLWVQ